MKHLKDRLLDVKNLKFEVRDVMRYDDVGDYFGNNIIAYDFQNDVITNAIFLHEFVEYMLIKAAGIDPALIDKFDTEDDAPDQYPEEYDLYDKFHEMANMVERQFIENLGLNWDEHDRIINTKKVRVAMRRISEELHREHPNEEKIEEAKDEIEDETEE